MASYSITIAKSAEKELAKLPIDVIDRIQLAVNALAIEPRPTNCKKLKGFKNLYRIRSGDYRIVYSIEDQVLSIEVVRIGNRKDIYS
ncbi:type II toxin-antitoxin system RelE family toxin [Fibrella aquatica]|jgi:mRNA interferase RelE/StbE|uniref:type II toxin-antitoxin system RelE family toxin n=1 Tax=Fibrella aquatica TaxID=3242487 RepID=UPI00352153E5